MLILKKTSFSKRVLIKSQYLLFYFVRAFYAYLIVYSEANEIFCVIKLFSNSILKSNGELLALLMNYLPAVRY